MSQKKIDGFRFLRLCVFCDYSVFLITIYMDELPKIAFFKILLIPITLILTD